MKFMPDDDGYVCKKCRHFCTTFNNGKTFGVCGEQGGFIWVKKDEFAPCGVRLNLNSTETDKEKEIYKMIAKLVDKGYEIRFESNCYGKHFSIDKERIQGSHQNLVDYLHEVLTKAIDAIEK